MKVIKISPRGYCHGVVSALQTVANTLNDESYPRPIYILGEIVHNQNVTNAFKTAGAITLSGKSRLEMLNKVDTGTIIVTAHGIDPNLIQLAKSKGLTVVDATCSDVQKTHNIISQRIKDGFEVLYIGKKGHPEPEGAVGVDPQHVHLVTNEDDIDKLDITSKVCITNQTTMSIWDTRQLMKHAQLKFPNIEIINEICMATQQRQEAVWKLANRADLTIVVGDPNSNNTNKLVEVSMQKAHTNAIRIESLDQLDINLLLADNINCVAVTSGASTPTIITTEIINFLEKFEKNDKSTWNNQSTIDLSRIVPRGKRRKND